VEGAADIVGSSVGLMVGPKVGAGDLVGRRDVAIVGIGESVGAFVGALEGIKLGRAEGLSDGGAEGRRSEGASEGTRKASTEDALAEPEEPPT
jgi:hypothetical protein